MTVVTGYMGWLGAVLAIGVLWLQTLPYIGSISMCENIAADSSRADLCATMSPWGRIWILAVPPILVLFGGIWGQHNRQIRFLLSGVLAAGISGMVLPFIAFEVTGPR